MPAGPRVAQVMPTKILDTGPFERRVTGLGGRSRHRLALVGEHIVSVFALLVQDHAERGCIQGYADGFTRLRLIRVYPAIPRCKST
jgi:hypothetical protein